MVTNVNVKATEKDVYDFFKDLSAVEDNPEKFQAKFIQPITPYLIV